MSEVSVAKTANRSVVGTMNEFALLAESYREHMETSDLVVLSMRLAETPCSAIKYNSPAQLLKECLAGRLDDSMSRLFLGQHSPGRGLHQ